VRERERANERKRERKKVCERERANERKREREREKKKCVCERKPPVPYVTEGGETFAGVLSSYTSILGDI